eukprot:GILJ01007990.1.p2 GENE.GILJ01007990.1~~GILJ01007990.1.p2  ORF type:complete len:107 (-),score=16.12 GILJ01007990.1:254-574(-)
MHTQKETQRDANIDTHDTHDTHNTHNAHDNSPLPSKLERLASEGASSPAAPALSASSSPLVRNTQRSDSVAKNLLRLTQTELDLAVPYPRRRQKLHDDLTHTANLL